MVLQPLRHPVLWYGIAAVVLGVVAVISLVPVSADIGTSDKLLHFLTYLGLSFGFMLLSGSVRLLLISAVGLVFYGVAIELLQGLTGYRYMEVLDMLANGLGVLAAVPLWWTPLPRWFRLVESRL